MVHLISAVLVLQVSSIGETWAIWTLNQHWDKYFVMYSSNCEWSCGARKISLMACRFLTYQ